MSEYMEDRIDEYVDGQPVSQEHGFVVDDDQKAEWCIRKITEAKKEMMDWIEFYVAQTDKVKDRCQRRIQFFEAMLEQYFRTVPHKQTKTQESYQLPSGKLVVKKQQPEYIREDDRITEWLDQSGLDYLIERTPKWGDMKKCLGLQVVGDQVVTADGEIIPGLAAVERPDVFKVEVK